MHSSTLFTSLTTPLLLLLLLPPPHCNAHLSVKHPPPLGSRHNPYSPTRDWSLTSPLNDSSAFPCKQYHQDASYGAGHPVVSWPAGSTQNFTLEGSAWHGGGSCQVSLSYDNGKRWKVVKSFIGGCPGGAPDESLEFAVGTFTVPKQAEQGEALFAWTWFNRIGNREMYMSCAVVTITEPESSPPQPSPPPAQGTSPPSAEKPAPQLVIQNNEAIMYWDVRPMSGSSSSRLEDFPDILVAQLEGLNDCYIPEGEQVEFPHPGRDVQRGAGKTSLPRGNCEYVPRK